MRAKELEIVHQRIRRWACFPTTPQNTSSPNETVQDDAQCASTQKNGVPIDWLRVPLSGQILRVKSHLGCADGYPDEGGG